MPRPEDFGAVRLRPEDFGAVPMGNEEAIQAALDSTPNIGRKVPDSVKRVVVAAIKKGIAGVPAFFADAIQRGGNELEKLFPITPDWLKFPMDDAGQLVERGLVGDIPQGQGSLEKIAIEGGAGAIQGGATAPGAAAAKIAGALGGAGGGAGAETGAAVFGDNIITRVAGALLGGSAVGLPKYIAGSTARRVNEVAKEVPDATLAQGQQRMIDARKEGINLSLPQAVDQPTPLKALSEDAATSTSGPQHTMLQAGQTAQAKQAANKMTGLFGLPEANPVEVAESTQKAATAAVERARKLRTKVTEEGYAFKVKKLPEESINALDSELSRLKKAIGATTPAGKFIDEHILNRLQISKPKKPGKPLQIVGTDGKPLTDDLATKAGGKWETNPEALSDILKGAKAKLDQPNIGDSGVDRNTASRIRQVLEPFQKYLDKYRVAPAESNKLYGEVTDTMVNPQKRSPVGQIASPSGVDPEAVTKVDQIFKVLDSPNIRAQSISKMQVDLDKSAPGTFAQYSKTAMERKLEAAFKSSGGSTPLDAPTKFAQSLWGGAEQTATRENFRATMAASARSMGKTPQEAAEFVRGMEKLLTVIEASGRGKVISTTPAGKATGLDIATDVARAATYTPQAPGAIGRTFHNLFGGAAARRQVFDMIWTPEGVDKIRQYAALDLNQVRTAFTAGVVEPLLTHREEGEK